MGISTYFPGRGTITEEKYLEGKAEGRVEERADMVLRALNARGVPVSAEDEERVRACHDLDTLGRWVDRALTATTAEEVFAEPTA